LVKVLFSQLNEVIMKIRKFFAALSISGASMFAAVPAHAGIPVIDVAALVQAITQVMSWMQQAQQMVSQIQQMQQQVQGIQNMTSKLEGMRSLGSILNDPSISSVLPAEMRNASSLLMNPSGPSSNSQAITGILSSFGINTQGLNGVPANLQGAADSFLKAQAQLQSAQSRQTQIGSLKSRVDTTADAKDSSDLANRNILEAASIQNDIYQQNALNEINRQQDAMRAQAKSEQFWTTLKAQTSTRIAY
jgi:type IV secretion system protein VirB5